ncbi:MAG: GspE/PulE family protein [Verrucomicrobiota bacterium]
MEDKVITAPNEKDKIAPPKMPAQFREYFNPENQAPTMADFLALKSLEYNSEDLINWLCVESGIPYYQIDQPHPTQDILDYITECSEHHYFGATSELPWLPLTMVGPIPVLGHFHPYAEDFYGFRKDLVFCVLISPNDYNLIAPTVSEAILANQGDTKNALQQNGAHGFKLPQPLLEWMLMEGWCPHCVHQGFTPESFLKNNPPHRWALEMLLDGKRIVPYNTISLTERNLAALPQAMMEKYQMVCYHRLGDVYYIATSNPSITRSRLVGELNARIGTKMGRQLDVVCGMAYAAFIEGAVRYLMSGGIIGPEKSGASVIEGNQDTQRVLRIDYDPSFTRPLDPNMEPPEILKWVLFRSISMKSSDIHLQECEENGEIRFRLNGALALMATLSLEQTRKVMSLIKLSSDLNVAEKRLPQDGRFTVELKGQTIDARVSTVPVQSTGSGESCVIRLINKQTSLKSIKELELPPRQEAMIRSVLEKDHGLILVTGPTGSGKTSSLYAFLNEINTVEVAIVTIEDPVEIILPRAKQLQVNTAINLTFARLLRSVLRHDPDIIMVGEVRDRETADHAIQAAQTGHLVFATLHTNDSLRAIPRMEALGIDRNQLSNSLLLVQAQRLVRVLCRNCRKARKLHQHEYEVALRHIPKEGGTTSEYQAFYQEWVEMLERVVNGTSPVYDSVGCLHCNQTGYNKRRAVMELFPIDDYMRDMIENGAKVGELSQYVHQMGYPDLSLESLRQFIIGETSFHEIQGFMKI